MELVKKYLTSKNIIFIILMAILLIFIPKIKDIAILFFASYVISCSLNPIVDKISTKIKRSFAATFVILGSLLILALFVIPIIVMGGHQIKSFLTLMPDHIETVKSYLLSLPFIEKTSLMSQINLSDVVSSASDLTSNVLTRSIDFSKGFASSLIYFLAAIIIIYYFLADKDTVREAYMSFFPAEMKNRAREIIESISQKIGGYVIAQIVTMLSVGFIVMIGLMILGIDYALILGLLTAVFDIVPVVGPMAALVVILLAVYKLGALKVGLVILIFAFAQWAENNLVRPYIFSKFLDLHPLVIYFFLFITAQYLGVIGVIFAPAIAATVCVLIEELYIKNINKQV